MTRLYGLEIQTSQVHIPLPSVTLEGVLSIPDGARAIIVFAQGRGSCRTNAVDTYLAAQFQHAGFATLLPDLYTQQELEDDLQDAHVRFNVRMLSDRLVGACDWLVRTPATHLMTVGFMGASTAGGAALIAAGSRPESVTAVVCRGARPDLAGSALRYVHAPTLLIVGENDSVLLSLNEAAADQMSQVHKLAPIQNAGHDFAEPGALEQVASQALSWFSEHLTPNRAI